MLSNELALRYTDAVQQLLKTAQMQPDEICAIGAHGQTVRHSPENGYTLQLVNPSLLVEKTNITVVADFRSRDMAAGGQGAPLVPAFHDVLFRHPTIHRVVVNIGGISNLSDLPPNKKTIGFDCGPGNMLMDEWCRTHLNQEYDKDGRWASSGKVLPDLLKNLLSEPFLQKSPPKSTGRELFNKTWLEKFLHAKYKNEDVQATLLAFTVECISQSIINYCKGAEEIYLCGGGARNRTLVSGIQDRLKNIAVKITDDLGVNADFLEAHAFAWLAYRALNHMPINLSHVTGAKGERILGAIYYAK
jgi:anhydro-N-acetylmuramic acid kinase